MSKAPGISSMFKDLHVRLVLFSLIQSFYSGSTFYGMTVINVPASLFKNFTADSIHDHYGPHVSQDALGWLWTILVASTTLGPLVGSFLLNYLAHFGRRNMVMIWNNLFLIVSCAFQSVAIPLGSYECLLVGRLINGVVVGLWSIVPVYLAECSPDSCRGLISMTVGVGWTFWLLIGAALGLPQALGTASRLPYLLAVPIIPALMQILSTPLFPKSPKFLYISEQNVAKTIQAIRFYHGDHALVDQILKEYEREAQLTHQGGSSNQGSFLQILKRRHLRWPFALCLAAVLAAECAATDVIQQYSTGLLTEFGLQDDAASTGTVISLLPPFVLSLAAPFVVEFYGRRKIVIFGIVSGLFSVSVLFVAGLIHNRDATNALALIGVITSYIGVWSGFGAVSAILPGELVPEGIRSQTASASAFSTWIPAFIILMVFPIAKEAWGPYSYLPFIGFGVLFGVFLYVYMPETKGRAVDEIIDKWVDKDGDRNNNTANEETPLLK